MAEASIDNLVISIKQSDGTIVDVRYSDIEDASALAFFAVTHAIPHEHLIKLQPNTTIKVYGYPCPSAASDGNTHSSFADLLTTQLIGEEVFQVCDAWQPQQCKQTDAAMSCFLSTLSVMSGRLTSSQKSLLLDQLCRFNMFPPAWQAFGRILHSSSHAMNVSEKTLIATELYTVFRSLLRVSSASDDTLFEHAHLLFAFIRSQIPENAKPRSSFKTLSTTCARTFVTYEDPVALEDGTVVNSSALKDGDVVLDPTPELLARAFFVTSCTRRVMVEIQLLEPVESLAPMEIMPSAFRRTNKDRVLRLVPPLSLKQSAHPCLCRAKNSLISVCTSGGGGCGADAAMTLSLFTPFPINGVRRHKADPQQLAAALGELGVDDTALDDRLAEELIVVCIDTSRSMNSPGFPTVVRQRYDDNQHVPEVTDSIEEMAAKINADPNFDVYKDSMTTGSAYEMMQVAAYSVYGHPLAIPRWQEVFSALNNLMNSGSAPPPSSSFSVCPISGEPFIDPVMTCDGQTYEREAILRWFALGKQTSPLTNKRLANTVIHPNYALKALMEHKAETEPQMEIEEAPLDIEVEVYQGPTPAKNRPSYTFTRRNKLLAQVRLTVPSGATLSTILSQLAEKYPEVLEHQSTLATISGQPIGPAEKLISKAPQSKFVISLQPAITIEVEGDEMLVQPGDTCFSLLYNGLGARKMLRKSLWYGLKDIGDGGSSGHLIEPDQDMYSFCSADRAELKFGYSGGTAEANHRRWKYEDKEKEKCLSRMDVAKSAFESFMDRTAAYDHPHRVGLLKFSSTVSIVSPVSSVLDSFRSALSALSAQGDTALYDCIEKGRVTLLAAKETLVTKNLISPDCVLRIIALTDGDDTCSKISLNTLISNLRGSECVVDGLSIGLKSTELRKLTYASGGLCFSPSNMGELMNVMELETFVRLSEREYKVPTNPSIKFHNLQFDLATGPTRPKRKGARELGAFKVRAKPQKGLVARGQHTLRIMAELKAVHEANHPCYSCFLSEDDLALWRVVMIGPQGTPYEGGVFQLAIQFPDDYPQEPPVIRFTVPVLHCNTNSYGKICHSILGRAYDSDYSVSDLLNCVYGLFLTPEVNEPIDVMLAALYNDDRDAYEAKIVAHVRENAGESAEDLIARLLQQQ